MADPNTTAPTSARPSLPAKLLLQARVRRLQEDHPAAAATLVMVPPNQGIPELWLIRTSLPYVPGLESLMPGGLLSPFAFPDGRMVFAFGGVLERDLVLLAQVAEDAISMRILEKLSRAIEALDAKKGPSLDLDDALDWKDATLPGTTDPNLPLAGDFLRRLQVRDAGPGEPFRFQVRDPAQPHRPILAVDPDGGTRWVPRFDAPNPLGYSWLPRAAQKGVFEELHPCAPVVAHEVTPPNHVVDCMVWLLSTSLQHPAVMTAWHDAVAHTFDGDASVCDVVLFDGAFWAVGHGPGGGKRLVARLAIGPDEPVISAPLSDHPERADHLQLLRFMTQACGQLMARDREVFALKS